MMKAETKKAKATRRGIYFSEEDADLLEFIDSQEVSASKFVTQLIREKKESVDNEKMCVADDISNRELLHELRSLIKQMNIAPKPEASIEVESSENVNYGMDITSFIDDMDDFS